MGLWAARGLTAILCALGPPDGLLAEVQPPPPEQSPAEAAAAARNERELAEDVAREESRRQAREKKAKRREVDEDELAALDPEERRKVMRRGTGIWATGVGITGLGLASGIAGAADGANGGHIAPVVLLPLGFSLISVGMPITMVGTGARGHYDGWRGIQPLAPIRRMEVAGWTTFVIGMAVGLGSGMALLLWPSSSRETCPYCITYERPGLRRAAWVATAFGPVAATIGGGFGTYATAYREARAGRKEVVRIYPSATGLRLLF